MKTYIINEAYLALQGEGIRVGTPNIFLRFAHCNLKCDIEPGTLSPGGFSCDTEFASGRKLSLLEVLKYVKEVGGNCKNIVCSGGEPSLQLDYMLMDLFQEEKYYVTIETNGTKNVDHLSLDWVTVSPKVAEHAIKQKTAHEVKYVRGFGQALPETVVEAQNYLISPAFDGTNLDERTLAWCIKLVEENPTDKPWRLSVQMHKYWKMR